MMRCASSTLLISSENTIDVHIVMQRGRTGEIDAQRRLAHGGAPFTTTIPAGLQALGHVVDIAETVGTPVS